jgi:ribosomal protein S18 acetylase RimI-like enzyme
VDVLDNPVWHALTGPQETVAERRSAAARFARDVAAFSALPDEPDERAWDDLLALVGPGGFAVLFVPPPTIPPSWEVAFRFPTLQMVATSVEPIDANGARLLHEDDVDEMLALVERTRPGPFERRTIELGDYLGVHEGGALVAMAGERMQLPGYREISAVCTDERMRGRGIAGALVRDLVGRMRARDETPILHVLTSNTGAIRVYLELGFTIRREADVIGVRAPH